MSMTPDEIQAEARRRLNEAFPVINGVPDLVRRLIEEREAFKQEVSEAIKDFNSINPHFHSVILNRFVITPPVDPLEEKLRDVVARAVETMTSGDKLHEAIIAEMPAFGLKIVEVE